MPILQGTSNIETIKIGTQVIKEVYSGTTLVYVNIPDIVFNMTQPPNLGQWTTGTSGGNDQSLGNPSAFGDKIRMRGWTDSTGPFTSPANNFTYTPQLTVRANTLYNFRVVVSAVNTPASGSALSWNIRDGGSGGSIIASGTLNTNGTLSTNFTAPASGQITVWLNTACGGSYLNDFCEYQFRDFKVEKV